jgi:hypothetical protein
MQSTVADEDQAAGSDRLLAAGIDGRTTMTLPAGSGSWCRRSNSDRGAKVCRDGGRQHGGWWSGSQAQACRPLSTKVAAPPKSSVAAA